jgi:hypothetical protein
VARYPASIHMIADLECELDGKSVSFRSTGRKTIADVPDLATGLNLIGSVRHGPSAGPCAKSSVYSTRCPTFWSSAFRATRLGLSATSKEVNFGDSSDFPR